MAINLLATNVLLRLSDGASPEQARAGHAVAHLRLQGDQICITAQNLIECWAVATRPLEVNGLGWSPVEASAEIQRLLDKFPLLADSPLILERWLALVTERGIKGKRVPDARLVAVMQAHGVTHLLTFNTEDFKGYPDITLVHPDEVPRR
jgi:predicted nucleic acid-binding protein